MDALVKSQEIVSEEGQAHIKNFVHSQACTDGGFMDRVGKADLYYSVFGYTLALLLDLKLDVPKEQKYLDLQKDGKLDFIHSICLLRCDFLLQLIRLKEKSGLASSKFLAMNFAKDFVLARLVKTLGVKHSDLLCNLEAYVSKDGGYNHNKKGAVRSTIYANFLIWTLFQDLQKKQEVLDAITDANQRLIEANGSFANEENSEDGVTTSTAAGLIMSLEADFKDINQSKEWLKQMHTKRGGFMAARAVPIADLLSTSTALFALQLADENMQKYAEKSVNFINLHWDESGGFFGSVADMTCDVEYTYYALLGLGLTS